MSFDATNPSLIRRTLPLLLVVMIASAVTSCSRKEESVPESQTSTPSTTTVTHTVQVKSIDLGRALTSDRRVITTDRSFTPGDTIFASVVVTPPVPASEVTARWTASNDGVVVYESTEALTPGETEAVMQFKMVKPAGIPPGTYKLNILVDGRTVSSKGFTVQAP